MLKLVPKALRTWPRSHLSEVVAQLTGREILLLNAMNSPIFGVNEANFALAPLIGCSWLATVRLIGAAMGLRLFPAVPSAWFRPRD